MLYLAIMALHVMAVVVWIGGMLAVSLLLAAVRPSSGPFLLPENRVLTAVWYWDRRVTTPAMALAWGLGLLMAMLGHWFAAVWLSAKLAVILALSALHGIQAGALRRLVGDGTRRKPSVAWRFAAPGVLLSMAAAVALVVLKPF